MASKHDRQPDAAGLRTAAEKIVQQQKDGDAANPETLTPAETQQLLHELRVHQVELELQNEELRAAQLELGIARARYFDLYDLAPVGYLMITESGLIQEANLTAATLLGVPRSALVKQPFSRFLLSEDRDAYHLHRNRLFETGERQACELRMVKGDGSPFWGHMSATVAEDGGERVCRLAVSDITQHRFQEDQRELAARLVTLVNSPSDFRHCISVLTMSLQGWSACEAVGIRLQDGDDYPYYESRGFPAEFVEHESHLCVPSSHADVERDGNDLAILECMCGNVLRGRTDPAKPFFTAHGSFWTNSRTALLAGTTPAAAPANTRNRCHGEGYESVALIPLRDRDQAFGLLQFNDHRPNRFTPALIAHFEELADSLAIALSRRQADAALRASESRHAKMVGNIGDVIVIIDGDGVNRYKSPNIERCFGWKPEELVGQPALANVHPDDLAATEAVLGSILTEPNATCTTECRYRCKDGSYKWIEFTGVNLLHDPDIRGILGNYQDISQRRRAAEEKAKVEEQLQQAQKMEVVGRLAGGVAHDFNNMVGVILGHAELALEQVDADQPIHEDLEEIHKAANRSADLTRQLLTFARKQTVAPRILDLNETVSGTLKMLERLLGEGIRLNWTPTPDLWPVSMDASQIDQMLANLCVNARDAIAGEGCMTIETGNCSFDDTYVADHPGTEPGDYVRLSVSDTGLGMNPETMAHIFEPFFTTKAFGNGTGLGLSTVYGAVRQNHGFITVDSELGKGSTFTMYLPRDASKAVQVPTVGPGTPRPHGHGTILLAEDEPAILRMATIMLERQGYTVVPAATPGEAIRLAREYAGHFDLLITDVVMPEMNGRDLARDLLSLHPDLKCLFMSGYTADVIARHGVLEAGVNFIQKPFSSRELASKVSEALGRAIPPAARPT